METLQYIVSFEGCLPSEARSAAEDLEIALARALPDSKMTWEASHPRAQDMGSILNIVIPVLGTPTVVVFANTLKDWLKRRKDITVTLRNGKREIVLQNITYKEAEQLLSRLAPLAFPDTPSSQGEGAHDQPSE